MHVSTSDKDHHSITAVPSLPFHGMVNRMALTLSLGWECGSSCKIKSNVVAGLCVVEGMYNISPVEDGAIGLQFSSQCLVHLSVSVLCD